MHVAEYDYSNAWSGGPHKTAICRWNIYLEEAKTVAHTNHVLFDTYY